MGSFQSTHRLVSVCLKHHNPVENAETQSSLSKRENQASKLLTSSFNRNSPSFPIWTIAPKDIHQKSLTNLIKEYRFFIHNKNWESLDAF